MNKEEAKEVLSTEIDIMDALVEKFEDKSMEVTIRLCAYLDMLELLMEEDIHCSIKKEIVQRLNKIVKECTELSSLLEKDKKGISDIVGTETMRKINVCF